MVMVTDTELVALQDLPADDFRLYFELKSRAESEAALDKLHMLDKINNGMRRLERAGLVRMVTDYAYYFNTAG